MMPIVTAYLAAFFGVFLTVLTMRVIVGRVKLKVSIGDGGNPEMTKRIRAHGNFTEQAPMGLIMLAMAEMVGAPHRAVVALAIILLVGRLAHAWALSRSLGVNLMRQAGVVLTAIFMIATAVQIVTTLCAK